MNVNELMDKLTRLDGELTVVVYNEVEEGTGEYELFEVQHLDEVDADYFDADGDPVEGEVVHLTY